jgi:hypothetical protein
LQAGIELEEVPSFVTVQSVANAVMDVLDSLPQECTYCGRSEWKSEDGTHIHCGACAKAAAYAQR